MNRTSTLALITVLLLAACSSSGDAGTTTATETAVATSAAETTTSSSTTTTEVATTVATTSTTEATTTTSTTVDSSKPDWESILEQLSQRRVDVYANPDIAAIANVCLAGSRCEENLTAQINDFIARGERTVGEQPFDVTRIDFADEPDRNGEANGVFFLIGFTITVDPDGEFGIIVDVDGNEVLTLVPETTGELSGEYLLARFPDDPDLPWRVVRESR